MSFKAFVKIGRKEVKDILYTIWILDVSFLWKIDTIVWLKPDDFLGSINIDNHSRE